LLQIYHTLFLPFDSWLTTTYQYRFRKGEIELAAPPARLRRLHWPAVQREKRRQDREIGPIQAGFWSPLTFAEILPPARVRMPPVITGKALIITAYPLDAPIHEPSNEGFLPRCSPKQEEALPLLPACDLGRAL
jgi:hypothetical protein